MNTHQLIDILRKGSQLQKEDITHLIKWHETFPYFQIPKVLLAKFEYEKTKGTSKELLHWSAVTSPDRSWLKLIIESDTPFSFLKSKLDENLGSLRSTNPHSLRSITLDDFEKSLIPEPSKDTGPQERADILKKLGEDLNKKKAKFPEIPKEKPEVPQKPKRRKSKDELIETIKLKEKKEILDEKKKKQLDIIKAFSKKEFKLATLREMEDFQKQDDLSEKSTHLHPTLLSESYAKLLVKQGKKQKAKEIYQKLMVKFPDKNAYFADLIKELDL
ncbi:hypothetical protein [Aquiflexum sp.]|uniref:hypothetical protein n=1 Tax=Aquiflexum sp. TaxID=1872584 RepID=UPI00359458F1